MVQFASYSRRVLCKTRLIFPRINGPNVDPSGCSFPTALFLWRQVVMGGRDISLQNVVNCLREKQKVSLA